ncbi:GPR154 [Mytilus edulis]|uniref:NPSR1 n=1 Tax=Mytilus edulis TaxID=6550 RepID=A0A8S3Q7S2_MYTED|nr:GPR154 [Mytilus edulis]
MTNNITINWSIILNKATESSIEIIDQKGLKWISLLILLGIIFLNILVVVLLVSRKPKSRMRFFVANLAIADLCVGMLFVLPETLFNWFDVSWNPYACYILYVYFSMVPFYVSTYAIVVLSIDRAYVILKPFASASKRKIYRYGMAMSSWMIGCILAIPYGVFGTYSEEEVYCSHEAPSLVMLYLDLCTIIIIPLLIISVCYIIIIIKLCERKRCEIILNKDSDDDCDIDVKHPATTKAKVRTIKLVCVVFFAYIICWSPITIAAIMLHHNLAHYGLWFVVLYMLAPLNSLVNPLVFLIFNQKMFRHKKKKGFSRTTFDAETQRVTLCS